VSDSTRGEFKSDERSERWRLSTREMVAVEQRIEERDRVLHTGTSAWIAEMARKHSARVFPKGQA
jgi:hypothetical protein